MFSTLVYLRDWGFMPQRIVDVGAYEGEWTRQIRAIYPHAEVLMVEPQQSKKSHMRQVSKDLAPGVAYAQALLGPSAGMVVNFVEMESGSSVLEEQTPDWFPKQYTEKKTQTLDQLVRDQGWPGVDLLKLDVQGYELEVLKGGMQTLQHAEIVVMEASLIPINQGCPTIEEVLSFMKEHGFRLLDLCDMHRRRDRALWQVDVVFVNETSPLVPEPRLTEKNWALQKA